MSIYDALKDKGSTGGRNIEEAIRNLPEGGGGGGGEVSVFVVNATPTENQSAYILDKTYAEIKEAYLDGQQVVLYGEYTYSNVVDSVETDFQHQIVRSHLNVVEDHRYVDAETGDTYQRYSLWFSNSGLGNIPYEYASESEDGYPGYIF